MLTDHLLNIFCICCLSDKKELQGEIPEAIDLILNFYQTNSDEHEITIDLKKKFELIKTICKLRISNKGKLSILDDIISSKKFSNFESYIKLYSQKEVTDTEIQDYISHIQSKRKFCAIAKDFTELNQFVDEFNSNSFDDTNQAIEKYDSLISKLYVDLMEEKTRININKVSSLDLLNDNYDRVIQQLSSNNSGVNNVPTGYKQLDHCLKKGYNPSRLYIFGGSSGDGKSTYLVNNLVNAVELDNSDETGLTNIYLYATLENLLDESLLRIYCAWKNENPDKIIDLDQDEQLNLFTSFIKTKCQEKNATIVMEYFAPTSLSVFGLRHWIQSVREKYKGKGRIRAVYIDYLDLLKSDKVFDIHRLELGQITLLLKAVAVMENLPVITVTQLNRQGYDKDVFSLTTISESIKKVEHADLVALLHNLDEEEPIGGYQKLEVFIGKNRNGPKNLKFVLRSKFSNFVIKDGIKSGGLAFDQGVKKSAIITTDNVILDGLI